MIARKFLIVAMILTMIFSTACARSKKIPEPDCVLVPDPNYVSEEKVEIRGVWFSFYDWLDLPRDEIAFRQATSNIMNQLQSRGLNSIFVHVHSHSDSYYPSKYFPPSKFATGSMWRGFEFDPLKIFIDEAHQHGIQFHAWLNPYRVTSTNSPALQVTWDEIPESSIVKIWKNSSPNQRFVLYHNGQYYLNPANEEVVKYLTDSITELVKNYDVDGIHFDDYFYPSVSDSNFDRQDYDNSYVDVSISQWRRDNVSGLVRSVYLAVKNEKPNVKFGISPAGNLDHLRSDSQYFTDIDRWMSEPGFIDYILPQIYWGFDLRNGDGSLSKYAFEPCLNDWLSIPRDSNVDFYAGLALYKTGRNNDEWIYNHDIIAREIQSIRNKNLGGFVLFDYRNLFDSESADEVQNMVNILQ